MADTYTEFLNLTKPEVGGSRDSWGVKQNDNLGKLDAWAKAIDVLAKGAIPKTGGDVAGPINFKGDVRRTDAYPGIQLVSTGKPGFPYIDFEDNTLGADYQWRVSRDPNSGNLNFMNVSGKSGQLTVDGDLYLDKLGGNVSAAIAAAAKAGNDALAKAVAKTGDTMTGVLRMEGGDTGQGVVFKHTDGGSFRVRMIGGNRLQFCDDARTIEYFSFGSGGDISTRQLGDLNTWAERRMTDHQNAAVNRVVTQVRWVFAGSKGYNDQPGTGGFISPFGGHAMNCDYWSWRFATADGQTGSAPFAGRWRALQVFIPNNGDWVTIGAAS